MIILSVQSLPINVLRIHVNIIAEFLRLDSKAI